MTLTLKFIFGELASRAAQVRVWDILIKSEFYLKFVGRWMVKFNGNEYHNKNLLFLYCNKF